jgi:hypothetical protein
MKFGIITAMLTWSKEPRKAGSTFFCHWNVFAMPAESWLFII